MSESAAVLPVLPTLPALVGVFGRVGVLAFGGGVTTHLLHHFTRRAWLSEAEYLDAVSWCQNLPGPNATNLSAFLGFRFAGTAGACLCTLALVLPGAVLVLALALVLTHVPDQALVRGGLATVAAAAVGLLLGAVAQLAPAATPDRRRVAVAMATAGLVIAGVPTPLAIVALLIVNWPRTRTAP